MKKQLFTLALLFIAAGHLLAQQPQLYTRPSQKAKVYQQIGTTDIEIIYHAPLAKGREVFGGIVVYDEVINGKSHPWRAGANENTIISFSHNVMINGKPLPAGNYGLHMFVSKTNWQVTFSKDYQSWGSFSYTSEKDALRVSVPVIEAENQDWLSYRFLNPRPYAVTVEMHWANKLVQFEISTNVDANIIADIEKQSEKTGPMLAIAAQRTINLEPDNVQKAMEYIDASIAKGLNLSNATIKIELLEKMGKNKEAEQLKADAISKANAVELFSYAMSLNNNGKSEEALKILALNKEKHPDHWYAYMGYANFYRSKKDPKAVGYYEKMLELAPERGRGFATYQLGFARSMFSKK